MNILATFLDDYGAKIEVIKVIDEIHLYHVPTDVYCEPAMSGYTNRFLTNTENAQALFEHPNHHTKYVLRYTPFGQHWILEQLVSKTVTCKAVENDEA